VVGLMISHLKCNQVSHHVRTLMPCLETTSVVIYNDAHLHLIFLSDRFNV